MVDKQKLAECDHEAAVNWWDSLNKYDKTQIILIGYIRSSEYIDARNKCKDCKVTREELKKQNHRITSYVLDEGRICLCSSCLRKRATCSICKKVPDRYEHLRYQGLPICNDCICKVDLSKNKAVTK